MPRGIGGGGRGGIEMKGIRNDGCSLKMGDGGLERDCALVEIFRTIFLLLDTFLAWIKGLVGGQWY